MEGLRGDEYGMILIGTPMYGGFCQQEYFRSCLNLVEELTLKGIPYDFSLIKNESLITRGRNIIADGFLKSEAEVLIFIDGDIEFTPKGVSDLWNLYVETSQVTCGAYRRKGETETKVWKDGKEIPLPESPTEIDYAGTGFMLIPRQVLYTLKAKHPDWERRDGIYAFFQDDGLDLSEDYFFCKHAREAGFKIICDPDIKLTHWGRKGY